MKPQPTIESINITYTFSNGKTAQANLYPDGTWEQYGASKPELSEMVELTDKLKDCLVEYVNKYI